MFFAASLVGLSAVFGSDLPGHTVFGEVYTYPKDNYWDATYSPTLSASASGQAVAAARTIDESNVKGQYSASASFANGLPRFALAAASSPNPNGSFAEVNAHYFGAQHFVVSGYGDVAPTTANLRWAVSGQSKDNANLGYYSANASIVFRNLDDPLWGQYAHSPTIVSDIVKTVDANGDYTLSGHMTELLDLKPFGPNQVGADHNAWAFVASWNGFSTGSLEMIAEAMTFPEFGGQSAEELGWTVEFGNFAPAPPAGGGDPPPTGGGSQTPEPSTLAILLMGLVVVCRLNAARSRVR